MNAPSKSTLPAVTALALPLLIGGAIALSAIAPLQTATAQPATAQPANTQPANASVWKRFNSAAGGFNLLMPGQPTENSSDGVTSFTVTRAKEAVTYTVSFIDFPVNPAQENNGINDAFAGIKEGITEEGGKVQQEQSINLNNFPGKELRVVMPDGAITRIRSYIVGKRLFLVMASTTKEASLKKSLQGFLDSFRIDPTQIPEATPKASPPPSPKASPVPSPKVSPTPSPAPTSTPSSTPSPSPSPAPSPSPSTTSSSMVSMTTIFNGSSK